MLAPKKKERCLMITENKLRILTNNPKGNRNRNEGKQISFVKAVYIWYCHFDHLS